ncbi:MAG TPA: MFS transporter, partial [Actinomycetota bacterium]|nr:MFS transporter [Actinomycetota bacterium]
GWIPALTIGIGLALGVAFVRRQRTLADPLLELKLFRIPKFSVSVISNAFTGFIAFGSFLYVAQYLQLVLGLSPMQAGLWTLPSSAAVIGGSLIAPAIGRRVRPGYAVAGGLTLAALGLVILTQVGGSAALGIAVTGSIVFALGLGPTFILATDLIIGTAPPERTGAASAISETGAEFGGALGIAVLGSIGAAVYRSGVTDAIPGRVPPAAQETARDTLGGAISVAQQLPNELGRGLVDAANAAFTQGLHLTAAIGAIIAASIALVVATRLRDVERISEGSAPEQDPTNEDPRSSGTNAVLAPEPANC